MGNKNFKVLLEHSKNIVGEQLRAYESNANKSIALIVSSSILYSVPFYLLAHNSATFWFFAAMLGALVFLAGSIMFGLLAIITAEMEVGLGSQSFEEVVNKSHDECLLELTGAFMGSFERNNKVLAMKLRWFKLSALSIGFSLACMLLGLFFA